MKTLLRGLFRTQLVGVWARNSYVFKDLTWRSDLDLTLLIAAFPNEQRRGFDARLRFWQKFSHGEWNVYFLPTLPLIAKVINPYELQRDPYLQAWLKNHQIPSPPETSSQNSINAAVYLIKHLSIDWRNLNTMPLYRRKKWQRHLQQVGRQLNLKQNFILQIQSAINQLLSISANEAKTLWQEFAEYQSQNLPPLQPDQSQFWEERPWLWSFHVAKFPFAGADKVPWTEIQKKIILSSIRWEIFAALTQAWQIQGFPEHLHRLEDFILQVFGTKENPECANLINDLETAQSFIKY